MAHGNTIKKYIRLGHEVIDSRYWSKWDEFVLIRLDDVFNGMDLEATLDIVKRLNDDWDMEDVVALFDSQGHSGYTATVVTSMVSKLCDRGQEFKIIVGW